MRSVLQATGIILFALSITLILFGVFPTNTNSNYEAENCEMGCRAVFDPTLNAMEYANCVEQCKRYVGSRPQL